MADNETYQVRYGTTALLRGSFIKQSCAIGGWENEPDWACTEGAKFSFKRFAKRVTVPEEASGAGVARACFERCSRGFPGQVQLLT